MSERGVGEIDERLFVVVFVVVVALAGLVHVVVGAAASPS